MEKYSEIANDFEKSALEYGRLLDAGNSRAANTYHDGIMSALSHMKTLSDHGEDILIDLQQHSNESVRSWAATYLLPLREEIALQTLRDLSSKTGRVAHSAEMVLKLWQLGKLKLVDWP